MDFIRLAKDNEKLCIQMRRKLHQIPELELFLPKTVDYIKTKLEEFNVEYEMFLDNKAVVAYINKTNTKRCLAIRADMDALPIQEENDVSYKSKHNNKMHACGHDSHMSIALTCCKILNENKELLDGCVKFIFQPGEEIPGGAKPLIEENVLKNPDVDHIIALHVGGLNDELEDGQIGFKYNEMMASMDRFSIKVKGKGGHGASPQYTIDPIIISAEILMALQKIVSREISPVDRALVSVCKINGGFTQNIIPNEVDMLGTARTLDESVRDKIESRITEISKSIAKAYKADAEVIYDRFYPVLKNDVDFTKYAFDISKKLFKDDVKLLNKPVMGGEDMAFYLKEVPGTFFFLSNLKKNEDGNRYPNHNPKFDLDESQFYKAIIILIAVSFDYLKG
ncbi:MAG: M20 family metallopeptidase [Tissierellia bacterium]|nr:M20 family metallopeptidase [Tissierellia bacterium]